MSHAAFDATYGVRNDGQAHFGAINLDCMPLRDLEIAAAHPALHSDVRAYASCAIKARTARLGGWTYLALAMECSLDRHFGNIPKRCRW